MSEQFEPAWQSLRPVPRVTIDFGNGNVVRRTLHGNVATYVCTSDGIVRDILPGIYEAQSYRRELARLAKIVKQSQQAADVEEFWRDYHRSRAEVLAAADNRRGNGSVSRGASIFAAERPTRRALRGEAPMEIAAAGGTASLAEALAEDTRINQTTRRLKIHTFLAESPPVPPDAMSKWLYREVLGTDLDDPYLGLGEALFKHYPFAEEDATEAKERTGP